MIFLTFLSCVKPVVPENNKNDDTTINEKPEILAEPIIHPSFSLTGDDLSAMTSNLPADIRQKIEADSMYFFDLIYRLLELPGEYLAIVDKSHSLTGNYAPDDLVDLTNSGLPVNKEGLELRQVIMDDLFEMNADASAEGLTLLISSAYRSYEYQEQVFQYHVNNIGEEQAKRESAEPGKSQHQLGTTIDFGSITYEFAFTPEGKWLREHAHEYGFSLSYPEDSEDLTGYIHEPWHFRWITRTGTELEREFFNGFQQHMLTFLHENRTRLEQSRWNS